jgi:hypothetical protein
VIKKQIHATKNLDKSSNFRNQPKIVTQYYPGLHRINNVIKTAFPILQSSPLTENLFKVPPKVVFKKPPNLKNILVRPKLPADEQFQENKNSKLGCDSCKKPRCKSCKIITPSNTFISSVTKKEYPIVGKMTCESSNVVYQLSCTNCPKDYIGQTITPLHIRMNKNRSDTNLKVKTNPLSAHAMEHNQNFDECYSLKPINQFKSNSSLKLTQLEIAHQKVLKTKQPSGLNLRFG